MKALLPFLLSLLTAGCVSTASYTFPDKHTVDFAAVPIGFLNEGVAYDVDHGAQVGVMPGLAPGEATLNVFNSLSQTAAWAVPGYMEWQELSGLAKAASSTTP